jgi:hypothetical protein
MKKEKIKMYKVICYEGLYKHRVKRFNDIKKVYDYIDKVLRNPMTYIELYYKLNNTSFEIINIYD